MTTAEVSDAVLSAPKVQWGFVQEIHRLDRSKSHRVPGGAGAWVWNQIRSTSFRVVVGSEDNVADFESEDILSAARSAFAKLKLPLPDGLR